MEKGTLALPLGHPTMRRLRPHRRLHLKQLLQRLASARTGFTLVEAIIVIGIMLVLASIAIPTYQDYVQNARDAKTSFSNKATANNAHYSSLLSAATAP